MKPYISLVTLGVSNLQKSFQFYEGLGFPSDGIQGDVAFFKLKGTWLSLYPRHLLAKDAGVEHTTSSFSGITLAHNVVSTEEVDALMIEAEKAGAVVTDPAHKREWGGYSGYFKDLDGYLWEVAWNPYNPELVQ